MIAVSSAAVAAAWTAVRAVGSRIIKKGLVKSAKKAYKYAGKSVKSGTKYTNKQLLNVQKKGSTYYTQSSTKAREAAKTFNTKRGHTKASIKANDAAIKFNTGIKKGSKVKKKVVPKLVKMPKRVVPKLARVKNPTKAHLKNPPKSPGSITYTAGAAKRLQPAVKKIGEHSNSVVNVGLYSLYATGASVKRGRAQNKKNKTLRRTYKR